MYIAKLTKERDDLILTLEGVMWFVDKWLDEDELKLDPVSRASAMREKTLKLVENIEAETARKIFNVLYQYIKYDGYSFGVWKNDLIILAAVFGVNLEA